jgi:hypothetical protein
VYEQKGVFPRTPFPQKTLTGIGAADTGFCFWERCSKENFPLDPFQKRLPAADGFLRSKKPSAAGKSF